MNFLTKFLAFLKKERDEFFQWLSFKLPLRLLYFANIRAHAIYSRSKKGSKEAFSVIKAYSVSRYLLEEIEKK